MEHVVLECSSIVLYVSYVCFLYYDLIYVTRTFGCYTEYIYGITSTILQYYFLTYTIYMCYHVKLHFKLFVHMFSIVRFSIGTSSTKLQYH